MRCKEIHRGSALHPALRRIWGRRGIALLSVLWVLTLLALMAASFTRTTRTETALARNLLENARAEALADAGVHLAAAGLLQPTGAGGWAIDGEVHGFDLEGGEVRVTIADEGGKIDLNLAAEELLLGLFKAAGVDAGTRAELVGAILDFRDPDSLRHIDGAEDDDYADAGYPYDAKDGAFEAVAELQQVMGMSPPLFALVAPAVTVHSRKPLPNDKTASPLVAAALAGQLFEVSGDLATPATGDLATPATGTPSQQFEADVLDPNAPNQGSDALRSRISMYAVHAEGRAVSGAIYVRDAILRLRGGSGAPYLILSWQQGRRTLFPLGETDAEAEDE